VVGHLRSPEGPNSMTDHERLYHAVYVVELLQRALAPGLGRPVMNHLREALVEIERNKTKARVEETVQVCVRGEGEG
jgi:hypothetical protein